MIVDTRYMHRCIQLAQKGRGAVSPNPMVGAVLVHEDKIIGEGYHREYGQAHAEVNAIASVKDKSLLKYATLYVSLEPCSHYGKTPPCAQLIIDSQIPNVVIGCLDPFPKVSGRGVRMLQEAGIRTKVGLLEQECLQLNKEFNKVQLAGRPYVYLKWAQSKDGFIDKARKDANDLPTAISNDFTKLLVHKLRSEVDAIMVGTNTVLADNPSLTTRLWHGESPTRIVVDRTLRLPSDCNIYDHAVATIVFTEKEVAANPNVNLEYVQVKFDENIFQSILKVLKAKGINSMMIEGGAKLLQSVINANLWDEAFVEIGCEPFLEGVKAPTIDWNMVSEERVWGDSKQVHLIKDQL